MSSATDAAVAEALRQTAARFGTPAYVTDLAALDEAAASVRAAFPDPWIRQYSVKANDVPAIVAEVAARGFGANVVSRGEWAAATPGRPAQRPDHPRGDRQDRRRPASGDPRDRDRSHAAGLGRLESGDEAEVLARMARRAGLGRNGRPPLDVLVRLNPDVTPETIDALAVGAGAAKFGMTETEATGVVGWLASDGGGRDPAARGPSPRRVAAPGGRCVA